MGIYVYARRNKAGAPISSTAVCAEHFYMSRTTPGSVGSPMVAHKTGEGPFACLFCDKGEGSK